MEKDTIKIIHCADIHLNSKMESFLSKEDASLRQSELISSFLRMVEYASKNMVEVILIAGDLFDAASKKSVVKKIIDIIRNHKEISFFYVRGNHDKTPIIEEFPENLFSFNNTFKSYNYKGIVISGIEQTEKDFFNFVKLDPNTFNILLLHANVVNSKSDNLEDINLKDFAKKNIDYLALGHIHSYKEYKIDERGIAVYSGCLEGRGFDECGKKGFVLLEIKNNSLERKEFIVNSEREYLDIEIDVTDEANIYSLVLKKLFDVSPKNIVRVTLVGNFTLDTDKDLVALNKKLKEMFFTSILVDSSTLKIDYKTYVNDVSLKGEFVRTVINDNSISKEEKEKILCYGIKALRGEKL